MSFVEVQNLWLRYGKHTAVRGLSFEVEAGEIFGLIGPNGAGKTSTIKAIATIVKPQGGHIFVDGVDSQSRPRLLRPRIGYLPDAFGVYEDLTTNDYLHFFAAAYGIARSLRRDLIADVLRLTDLEARLDARVETLSRGMKQRLGLARVLLHDPDLLLLDEPASGLDPRARVEIRELLKELGSMGKTIIVSSHILEDLAQICTSIGIVEAGRMVTHGTLEDIERELEFRRVVDVELAKVSPALLEELRAIEGVERVDEEEAGRIIIELREGTLSLEELSGGLHRLGARIRAFRPRTVDLETAFLALTDGETS